MNTSEGTIEIELFDEDAPKTVENFRTLARQGLLRRADLPPRDPGLHDPGRLPAGDRHRRARLHLRGRVQRPPVVRGALAMANAGPNTNGSQFFIVTADAVPVARRQAHRVRPGHRAAWTSSKRSRRAETDGRDRPRTPIAIESVTIAVTLRVIEVRNPATGELLATVPELGAAELAELARRGARGAAGVGGARLRRARGAVLRAAARAGCSTTPSA